MAKHSIRSRSESEWFDIPPDGLQSYSLLSLGFVLFTQRRKKPGKL